MTSELHRTIKAHFVDENRGLIRQELISFPPMVGDELRFSEKSFFVVTRLVWVFDEPEAKFTRLNIGVKEIEL